MTEVTPKATPSGPPAGWYDDPDGSPRQRWYDGTVWTDHYQSAASAPLAQAPVAVKTDVKKARDSAVYTRQQKGHSWVKHWLVLGIFTLWILPIYYTVSPNHYWHV